MKLVYVCIGSIALLVLIWFIILARATTPLTAEYQQFASYTLTDRNDVIIYQEKNVRGGYSIQVATYPEELRQMVLQKEDRFFYLHPGINPMSILRALFHNTTHESTQGGSTITQQLVKILSANEQERTLRNKAVETLLALGMEIRFSKDEILTMYLNTVNFGNQANGFAQASIVYFDTPIETLSTTGQLSLIATLSNPGMYNPWQNTNFARVKTLAKAFDLETAALDSTTTAYQYNSPTAFELQTLVPDSCQPTCRSTVDAVLSENIRLLMLDHVQKTARVGGTEMAVVVISVPENEVLAIVGSPDPFSTDDGAQINMALESRPIGSTIKPFIYAEAFKRGARPYTLVTDQEYRYIISSGFPLYPKNFDGTYQGDVTLEHALANSLNTPSIKLLDFISLGAFYTLLESKMQFSPINPLDSYAYGIALGGLEMDLLTLTHYFTTFPQMGTLHPLHITESSVLHTPQGTIDQSISLYATSTVEMINSILTERSIGVQQFGLRSNLAVSGQDVAVKTGTSRDFHDSWTIGYTQDYVVGVWLGNAINTPLDQVSGSVGAGPLWRQTMELLQNSDYNKETPFSFSQLTTYAFDNTNYYGLPDDQVAQARTLLLSNELITRPHDQDVIAFTENVSIELTAKASADWFVNEAYIGTGSQIFWSPPKTGIYTVTAKTTEQTESRSVTITNTTLWEAP
ncbi:MAG: penicillin-binding protein 1C [Patiriisocius sp.]|jgi:penicillin-binding protein 1C